MEPFCGLEKTIPLNHDKHEDNGWIRVRLNFQPEIIVKSRAKTSTFSTPGRPLTQLDASPLQTRKSIFHGVTRVFGRGGNHGSDNGSIIDVTEMGNDQASRQIGVGDDIFTAPGEGVSGAGGRGVGHLTEPRIVKVTVIEAKDYNPCGDSLRPYVILKLGDKEHKTSSRPKSASSECSW